MTYATVEYVKLKMTILAVVTLGLIHCGFAPKHGDAQPSASAQMGAATKATACLSDCNPPQDVLLSFGQPKSFAPANCTVSEATALPTGSGILALMVANCGGQVQAYSSLLDASGTPVGAPVPVSTSCIAKDAAVSSLVAEAGSGGFAVSFICGTSRYSNDSGVSFLDSAGRVITSFLFLDSDYVNRSSPALLAWNPATSTYGVALHTVFRRYTPRGVKVDADLKLPNSHGYPRVLRSGKGYWTVISGSDWSTPYCSRIGSTGTLDINDIALAQPSGQGVTIDQSDSIATASSSIATFSPVACALTSKWATGNLNDQVKTYYGSTPFGSRYLAQLYTNDRAVVSIAFMDLVLGTVLSTSGVTNATQVNHVSAFALNQKMYVTVAKDNDAVVVISDQAIPQ